MNDRKSKYLSTLHLSNSFPPKTAPDLTNEIGGRIQRKAYVIAQLRYSSLLFCIAGYFISSLALHTMDHGQVSTSVASTAEKHSRLRRICPHCDRSLSYSAYCAHKARFYDYEHGVWIRDKAEVPPSKRNRLDDSVLQGTASPPPTIDDQEELEFATEDKTEGSSRESASGSETDAADKNVSYI